MGLPGSIFSPERGGTMCPSDSPLADLASKVEVVLNSADLSAFSELLDPDVTWGAPGDTVWGCHNRDEVIAWYNRARAEGMAGEVTEVVIGNDALLVGLRVSGTGEAEEAGGVARRWQVLRVRDGRVVDIRGYPDRSEAATQAGVAR
jgi:ketosteroid isomerase-like protein